MTITEPVLIADADRVARESLCATLRTAGADTVEASRGDEALSIARARVLSAVVLDVALPGLSGYEVCRALRAELGEALPVIFVSATRTESFDRVAGLLIGANDYLVKPVAADELLVRLRSLLDRPGRVEPSVTGRLTRREREVLRLVSQGLAQPDIAQRLYITPKTVATHIEHILRKLGVHSRAQAIAVAYRENIVDPVSRI